MNLLFNVGSIACVWFLVVTIPGPNFVVVTQYSLSDSRKSGLLSALGISIGAGIWATASLLGLSVLFEHAAWLYGTIRVTGGIYLIYMGIKTLWAAVHMSSESVQTRKCPEGNFSAFQRGLLTSFSNPKTAAFFSSLFIAAFPVQAPAWIYFVTIGMVICVSLGWYGLVTCFFSLSGVQSVYYRLKRIIDILTGSLLSLLGGRLVFGRS